MNEFLDHWYDIAKRDWPEVLAACQPRRYISQPGYADPRHHAAMMVTRLIGNRLQPDEVMARCSLFCFQLLNNQVPTYFLDDGFVRAVAAMEFPRDLTFRELSFPFPATNFVLPLKFSKEYFGRTVPFIGVAPVEKRPYRCQDFKCLPPIIPINCLIDGVNFLAIVYFSDKSVDYGTSVPYDTRVSEGLAAADFIEYKAQPHAADYVKALMKDEKEPTKEEDLKINNLYVSLICKVLLVMAASNSLVKAGGQIRPERIKRNRVVKDALWHPNFIGRGYCRTSGPSNDTGRSVAMHFRRAHFAWQVFGPKEKVHRRELMPNDQFGGIDWEKAGKEATTAFLACHRRTPIGIITVNKPCEKT